MFCGGQLTWGEMFTWVNCWGQLTVDLGELVGAVDLGEMFTHLTRPTPYTLSPTPLDTLHPTTPHRTPYTVHPYTVHRTLYTPTPDTPNPHTLIGFSAPGSPGIAGQIWSGGQWVHPRQPQSEQDRPERMNLRGLFGITNRGGAGSFWAES